MNPTLIFAFGALISWGVGDFLIQRTVRKVGILFSAAWLGVIGSLMLFPFVISHLGEINSPKIFSTLVLLGLLLTFNALSAGRAVKVGKLSVTEVVLIIELPITIILGVIFFSDKISPIQLLLISFLLFGVVLSSISFEGSKMKNLYKFIRTILDFIGLKNVLKNYLFEKGVWFALLAATLLASMNFVTALNSRQLSPIVVIWFPWTLSSIFSITYIYIKGELSKFWSYGAQFKKLIIATGIIDVLAWIFYAFAVSRGELSITTTITESYSALAMFLGIKLNKEKISIYQYVGGIIALVSSIAIGLTI